jgi:hypothetical protein
MLNVIAVIMCTVAAIHKGINGDVIWCIVDALLAASNLPFAIEWIKDIYNT